MENEALVDEMIGLISQIMEVAGLEWTMEALAGLLEAFQQGGQEQQPEAMPQDMGGMPAQAPGPMPEGQRRLPRGKQRMAN